MTLEADGDQVPLGSGDPQSMRLLGPPRAGSGDQAAAATAALLARAVAVAAVLHLEHTAAAMVLFEQAVATPWGVRQRPLRSSWGVRQWRQLRSSWGVWQQRCRLCSSSALVTKRRPSKQAAARSLFALAAER